MQVHAKYASRTAAGMCRRVDGPSTGTAVRPSARYRVVGSEGWFMGRRVTRALGQRGVSVRRWPRLNLLRLDLMQKAGPDAPHPPYPDRAGLRESEELSMSQRSPLSAILSFGSRRTRAGIVLSAFAAGALGGAGFLAGYVEASPAAAPMQQLAADLSTLRVHGLDNVCYDCNVGQGNRPATAGSNTIVDPNTGRVPEDPPYQDPKGPFSPLSAEAPENDYVTWDPAWISERLNDTGLIEDWPGLNGPDEISRATNIRIGGVNGSEKVWLRHWYEPTHLDKDLNADDCLTDDDLDGLPDADVNPGDFGADDDEWYPAIMTEMTYVLMDNDLPVVSPDPDDLDDSAPRPSCGRAGRTRMVFPVGTDEAALDADGPLSGRGLTSLDADFDGDFDMVNVSSEEELADDLGVDIDFDGDGLIETIDPNGIPLDCDELIVLHTDAVSLGRGETLQFLDHFVRVRTVSDNSAVLEVWYNGDLIPRPVQIRTVGVGAVALAGDVGPLQILPPGGGNVGVPIGPWFVAVEAADVDDGTVTLTAGRALGAPCASMEAAPNATNLSPGGPWFLKRFYVDGHEYNTVALMTCDPDSLQYISIRQPLPKVDVTIEQHSVRLEGHDRLEALALPPPFNHEHTIVEDIVGFDEFYGEGFSFDDLDPSDTYDRQDVFGDILYMGGPVGPIPPVLNQDDALTYTGRDAENPVGPYSDYLSTHWFYIDEDVNPSYVGELKEKYGAVNPEDPGMGPPIDGGFFFNEQIFTRPWHYTEFSMPNQADPAVDPATGEQAYDPDNYYMTSGWINPYARSRRWTMPDDGVSDDVPPFPPEDLTEFYDGYFDPVQLALGIVSPINQYGQERRASFIFDPDDEGKIFANEDGARVFGGFPIDEAFEDGRQCFSALSRPPILLGAGDPDAATDTVGLFPVEVLPYTDPFAPFNPQHPHAPRTDSLTFNPSYMDEFRNFNEDLRFLYQQISNGAQNARQKVYHRLYYQPDYITKIREVDDCDRDLTFPAIVQEFTYLYMDTTDNPISVPVGQSRFAFPVASRPDDLPVPNPGGSLPAGGEFGYGLTSFDANFDGYDDALTVHTEATLVDHLDTQWQANRPSIPGFPPPPLAGPVLDFDGDGILDDLDEDCTPLNGNEMAVFAIESLTLDLDEDSPAGSSAMFLDHLVTLENVTPGSDVEVSIYFTGGNPFDARPERIEREVLEIGDALIADRFQDLTTTVSPGETNTGTDGAWFVFVEDIATDAERVTITIGRAIGGTHSAIDDGDGLHDLEPGDPWYLKRFYVDGHEYNAVALMTQTPFGDDPTDPAECNSQFAFLTIRTPVPKGNFFNLQDSLFQQGYFIDDLPDEMSVMPPFNVDHTIAVDVERIEADEFAWIDGFDACVGDLAPAEPMVERILEEEVEPRFGTELRETYHGRDGVDGTTPDFRDPDPLRDRDGWETHQTIVTPWNYTDIELPDGQQYLLTLNWRSEVNRLSFYGCTRDLPGPFTSRDDLPGLDPFELGLTHNEIAAALGSWAPPLPPENGIPLTNLSNPPQTQPENDDDDDTILPYYDGLCDPGETTRVKIFYDPTNQDDPYVNRRRLDLPVFTADIRLEKRASSSTVAAGGILNYTITVFNDGPDDVAVVNIKDTLPAGVELISDTDECDEGPAGVLNCTIGPIANGGSDSIALTVLVDDDLADGTELLNEATATAPGAIDDDPSNNSDSALTVVSGSADLRVTKSASDITPSAGQQVVYTVMVLNGGPSVAPNVQVVDTLPLGTTYVSDTDSCVQAPIGTLTCSLGNLDSGEITAFSITVMIDNDVPNGTVLTNSAIGSSDVVDPFLGNNEGQAAVIVTAEADIRLTKTADPDPVVAGEELTYTIRVINGGPSVAPLVQIVDLLPPNVTYLSDTDACVQAPIDTLTCTIGPLDPGEFDEFEILVRVDADTADGSQIRNQATATVIGADDPDLGNNSDIAIVDVEAHSDLSVEKRGPATAQAGDRIAYTLLVRNNGPSASPSGPWMTDTLPSGLTYVSDTGACDSSDLPELVCNVPSLVPGGTYIVTVQADIDGGLPLGTNLVNRVVVDSPDPDDDPTNDDDSLTTQITDGPRSDLAIDKDAPVEVAAGGTLVYTLLVNNLGPDDATNVEVTDTLPPGVSYVSSTVPCAETPALSDIYACSLGDIAAGASAGFAITVLVDGGLSVGTVLVNGASVVSDVEDPDNFNNVDVATTTVAAISFPPADLSISKEAPLTINPGEVIVYSINVTNNGLGTAFDVGVIDILPSGVSYVSDTASGGCAAGGVAGTYVCLLGTMANGDTVDFTITGVVDGGALDGDILTNSVSVTSSTPDVVPDNNTDTAQTTVDNDMTADLAINKKEGSPTVLAGGMLTYTITVDNLGPLAVPNVRVTDTLPVELAYVTDTAGPGDTPGCVDIAAVGTTLVCDLGPMSAGDSVSFVLTTMVDPGVTSGTSIINTAIVGPGVVVVGPDTSPVSATFAPDQEPFPIDPNPDNNQSSAKSVATRQSDLSVDKDASTITPDIGGGFDWTVEIKNAGPSNASNAVLVDVLPAGITYVSDDSACDTSGLPTISCAIGELTAGQTASVTIAVTVDLDAVSGAPLTNTASATSDEFDPDDSDNSDDSTVIPMMTTDADLAVSKVASDDTPQPGETVTFMLTVENLGPATASNVVLVDTLPAEMTYVSDDSGCDTSGLPTISCALGALNAGSSAVVEVVADVSGSALDGDSFINSASASSDSPDPNLSNNGADLTLDVEDPVVPSVDMTVDKTASDSQPAAGGLLTYTVEVINDGPSTASNVTVVDTIPAGMTYVSDTASCDTSGLPTITCSIGTVEDDTSTSFEFVVALDPSITNGQSIENTAVVSTTSNEPDTSNNTDAVAVSVQRISDLRLDKTVAPNPVTVGSQAVYTLRVDNLGPSDADAATVVDTLPAGLTYVADSAGCDTSGLPTLTCGLGAIGANQFTIFQVTVDATADAVGSAVNSATVDSDSADPSGDNNTSQAVLSVLPSDPTDLSLIKTVDENRPVPGAQVTYELRVMNSGPLNAANVMVKDTLPAGLTYVSDTARCDSSALPMLTCSLGNVANGGEVVFKVVAEVNAGVADGTILMNSAVVSSSTPDSNNTNNTAKAVINVTTLVGRPEGAACSLTGDVEIEVAWTDASTFETEFIVEVSIEDSAYAELAIVPSTSQAGTGQGYTYATGQLLAGTGYRFRVLSRNADSMQLSAASDPTSECLTMGMAPPDVGCYKGRIELQGRRDHGGVVIYLDKVPVTVTDSHGYFEFCGAIPGKHTIKTSMSCYRSAYASTTVGAGETVEMDYTVLPGGDVNNDGSVNLYDLVSVGAAYRTSPPSNPAADCTNDGAVNLFDLVLVGSNYGKAGYVDFGHGAGTLAGYFGDPGVSPATLIGVADSLEGLLPARPAVAVGVGAVSSGTSETATTSASTGSSPLSLRVVAEDEDEVTVDVMVRSVRGLYGAELGLSYDPTRVSVVDAMERAGVQVTPGAIWTSGGFVGSNEADQTAGTIAFTATRINPAPPVDGTAVLITITFKKLTADVTGAWSVDNALLLDKAVNRIPFEIQGNDLISNFEGFMPQVFLPMTYAER